MRVQFVIPVLASILILSISISIVNSFAQDIEWTRQFGTSGFDQGIAIAADSTGVYVTGPVAGTLPGQTSSGGGDAFVRKYDFSGTEQWTRQFGTSVYDEGLGITADSTGIYVTGDVRGSLPGQTSSGGGDAFVRKYDSSGTEQWTRQFGSSSFDNGWGLTTDSTGVYVSGFAVGSLPSQTSSGGGDAFVRKYDFSGTEQWTRQFGTSGSDQALGMTHDSTGIYVTGDVRGSLPGQTNSGGGDVFVRKYDSSGTEQWTRQFGTSGFDQGIGIAADSTGVYVSGFVTGTLPGQTNSGSNDAFVRKYDSSGTEQWTRQFGTSGSDLGFEIITDSTGVYAVGITAGTLPGQTSSGGGDAFVRKYDFSGTEQWTRQFGTSGNDEGIGITVDSTGVYGTGLTFGTFPGQTSSGDIDAFVVKISQTFPTAVDATQDIISDIEDLGLPPNVESKLLGPLDKTVSFLSDDNPNNDNGSCGQLNAFKQQVTKPQNGLDQTTQDELIAIAEDIQNSLGCLN